MNRLGIDIDALPHMNKTESKNLIKTMARCYHLARRGHGTWSIAIDDEVRWDRESGEMINALYRSDFDRLGYEPIQ